MHVGALQVMHRAVTKPAIAAARRRRWPKTASWPAVEPSTPLKRRRHDRAHEQLVDPALGLDGGGEFLERDLVEAASRVAWLSGRSSRRSSTAASPRSFDAPDDAAP